MMKWEYACLDLLTRMGSPATPAATTATATTTATTTPTTTNNYY